jgi:GntR family transcriptional regulator, transcriptional repressor for pyruvate dehydrogenase complex
MTADHRPPEGEPPLRRESVSDQLFARLRDRILTGDLAAGSDLDSERDLAERFGVNRHAVREAVKRLQQAQLIEVAHGGRTRVLDWRRTAGLDLVVSLPGVGGVVDVATAQRDTYEMRACIGADAARLCALRAPDASRAAIAEAAERFAQAGPDREALSRADIDWWRLIIEGCGNIAYLLSFNSLVGGTLAVGEMPSKQREAELLDVEAHRELARLIADRDDVGAERLARELLSRSVPDDIYEHSPEVNP